LKKGFCKESESGIQQGRTLKSIPITSRLSICKQFIKCFMKYAPFISGLAGSLVLTLLHETLRKTVKDAPRMDLMGKQGLAKILSAADMEVPPEPELFKITMTGDIIGNAGYYALVASAPKHSVLAGAALGLAAGVGALTLPDKIGLDKEYSNATPKTQILTVCIYFLGGLVAGVVYDSLQKKSSAD
jgi:hypothetical protein